jgi:hypothetical protein
MSETKTAKKPESKNARIALISLLQNRRQKLEVAREDLAKTSAAVEAQQAKWARLAIDDLPEAADAKRKLDALLQQRQDNELRAAGLAQGLEETLKDKVTRSLAAEAEKTAAAEIAVIEKEREAVIQKMEALHVQVAQVGLELMKLQETRKNIYSETSDALKLALGRKYQPAIRAASGDRLQGVPFRHDILQAWREANKKIARPERSSEVGSLFSVH